MVGRGPPSYDDAMASPGRQLEGRVVLVSGGASDIGRATALRLSSAGAAVVVGDVSADGAAAVAEDVEAAGGRVISIPVVPGYSTSAILRKIRQGFGEKPQPKGTRASRAES